MKDLLPYLPYLTPVMLAVMAWIGRRMLLGIHSLVNDRLDRALARIDDLEAIISEGGNGYHREADRDRSTAKSLRSHPMRRKGDVK